MTTVLIADDDAITRELIAAILEEGGYDTVQAASGDEALDVLERDGARLVLADWEMPGISGVELCARVRARWVDGYTYVILVTGRDGKGDVVEGLTAGADDYVTKPIEPTELLLRVRVAERVIGAAGRDLAIFALAKLADSRDPDTGRHLERTQASCRVLAEGLMASQRDAGVREGDEPVDTTYVDLITRTSPLHDIGKIGIPDSVLLKPARLTADEYEVMKRHTVIGAETIEAALGRFPEATFLRMARDIAMHHHERWDGNGYPCGLARNAIPLSARIMAVADVYDALRSRRAYKEAFSHERARGMMVEGAGSHFDPLIMEVFLAHEEVLLELHERLANDEQRDEPGLIAA